MGAFLVVSNVRVQDSVDKVDGVKTLYANAEKPKVDLKLTTVKLCQIHLIVVILESCLLFFFLN